MRKVEPWIQTFTGKKIWLNKPDPELICIEDIAHALSMICRFNGHTKFFYSVAEHSVLCSRLLPDHLKLAGLMHDAAEAYIGDVTSPLKQYQGGIYDHIHSLFSEIINKKYGIYLDLAEKSIVKNADLCMLKIEALQLFDSTIEKWHHDLPDAPIKTKTNGYVSYLAEELFLNAFKCLRVI